MRAAKDVQVPYPGSLHERRDGPRSKAEVASHDVHGSGSAHPSTRPSKDGCKFAHRKDELQDLPDLACTKLCDAAD